MNRTSQLLYSDTRTELRNSQSLDGEVLFQSPYGVPILWFFAFGARNVWSPGDNVADRGGAVGQRNPYETQIEVALTRLEYAEQALREDRYLWPWFSALPALRRKLESRPSTSCIRCAAPWILGLEEKQLDRWRAATAFVENAVYHLSNNRPAEGVQALHQVRDFSLFVPSGNGEDHATLESLVEYPDEPLPLRLALLTLGEPKAMDAYRAIVLRDCAEILEKARTLKPRTLVTPQRLAPDVEKTPSGSVVDRLVGFFRRSP